LGRFKQGSYADSSRFGLAKRGRTMIRIVGSITPQAGGSIVAYKIQFTPAALVALAASVLAAIPIFVAWSLLGYPVIPILLLVMVAVVLTCVFNFWISERQATWLRDYVRSTLDASATAQ
jgi:hypothetical protein